MEITKELSKRMSKRLSRADKLAASGDLKRLSRMAERDAVHASKRFKTPRRLDGESDKEFNKRSAYASKSHYEMQEGLQAVSMYASGLCRAVREGRLNANAEAAEKAKGKPKKDKPMPKKK